MGNYVKTCWEKNNDDFTINVVMMSVVRKGL